MSIIDDILQTIMSVPQQARGILGNLPLGIPQGDIKNSQGDTVFPTNALERGLQGSDNAAQSYAAAFMGPGARGAYRGAPDTLMGFGPKQINPSSMAPPPNFKYELPVRVQFPGKDFGSWGSFPAETIYDTSRGLNRAHALERAYRNWPNAEHIIPADMVNPFPKLPE